MGDVMTELKVQIDDEALAQAAECLDTMNPDDTINTALRRVAEGDGDTGDQWEAVSHEERMQAYDRLLEWGESGALDLLSDKRNYRR